MARFKIFVLCLAIPFMSCNKNNSSPDLKNISIKVEDVIQKRDSLNSAVKFRISVTPVSDQTIKVDYATEEGTAKAAIDYMSKSGTVTIAPGQSEAFIEVPVIGRQLKQSTQQFYLKLTNATGAQLQNDKATAKLENIGKLELVWSDEFNGTALNTSNWNYETGGGGWGNHELQTYTSGTNNAYIENGNLVIEAKKDSVGYNNYTSARITTKGKQKFTYGRVDIKAKLPVTKGIWPALWMLGENITTVNWPACGELDIMELIGKNPNKIYGTAHWGSSSANHASAGGNYTLPSGDYSNGFHVFSIEWSADKIEWSVDSTKFYELSMQNITGSNFPFDKDFFLIFNVAVGGDWPGNPDASSVFPQKMYVDYVRVYQR